MAKRVSPEAREIAGKIADQIQTYGHYQDKGPGSHIDWQRPRNERACCIVAGHPYSGAEELTEIVEAIVDLVGIESATDRWGDSLDCANDGAVEWNDLAKTEDVIDVLRAIEIG